MLVAKLAKLLHLDTIGVITFVFVGRVVSLFAIRTSQRDNNTHCSTPPGLT
jgi:hypothetical protein